LDLKVAFARFGISRWQPFLMRSLSIITFQDIMLSAENYVEVTLKPLHAPAKQTASNFIIVFVPRSQIKSFREKHQTEEAVIDELIAQALAERLAPDIWERTGSPSLIEKSRFLPQQPQMVKDRSPDYDRDGFRGWIFEESIDSVAS
jgi:hypothetical protein